LQAHVTKRTSAGLTGQFSYTYSKALGDNGTIRDERNLQSSKAVLPVDRTHVLVSNATYDLPFGANHKFLAGAPGWAQRIVEGWQVSSIASWQSGAPLNFLITNRGTTYFRAVNTPNLVAALPQGDVVRGNGFLTYFGNLKTALAPKPDFGGDTSLPGVFTNQVIVDSSGNTIFQDPVPGTIGNMSAYQSGLRGPGLLTFNAALKKSIKLGETKTFTLRADAVNLLNKAQFGNPNVDINSVNFGRITTSTGNRMITFNARIDF
jgi:hypothetical protein